MEDTQTQTISELAGEAYACFERAKRPDGDSFTRKKDGTPEWVADLVHEAHGEFLPDDWRYDAIWHALGQIHDSGAEDVDDLDDLDHEFADGLVDTYNSERYAWLSSNLTREGYVEEARDQGLVSPEATIPEQIGVGQYVELQEVFASVRQSLAERMDD